MEGQWGLEPTFQEWINKMLVLTKELKRVLKKSGTFWINIGDTYNRFPREGGSGFRGASSILADTKIDDEQYASEGTPDLPTKCLCQIPERLSIRMVDEQQWTLRNKIVWNKPNAMPASVTDRLKNSYELVYMFARNSNSVQWSNWFTGEGTLKKPRQQYLDFDGKTLLEYRTWRCKECGWIKEDKNTEHMHEEYDVTPHVWRGMDYYFDLDAIRKPMKDTSVHRLERGYGHRNKNYWGGDVNCALVHMKERLGLPREHIRKQDSVPGRNAPTYTGFNDRWNKSKTNAFYYRRLADADDPRKDDYSSDKDKLPESQQEELQPQSQDMQLTDWQEQARAKDQPLENAVNHVGGGNTGLKEFAEQEKRLKENKFGADVGNRARKEAFYNTSMKKGRTATFMQEGFGAKRNGWDEYKEKYKEDGTWMVDEFIMRGANPGDVWVISTQAYKEAHFATFPERLITPMILAGSPSHVCRQCGFVRERISKVNRHNRSDSPSNRKIDQLAEDLGLSPTSVILTKAELEYETLGWSKCSCNAGWEQGVVLDPFMGSGTVGVVAQALNRNWLGIDIKQEYIDLAMKRIYNGCVPLKNFV